MTNISLFLCHYSIMKSMMTHYMVSCSVQRSFSFIIIIVMDVLALYIVIVLVSAAKTIIIRRAWNKHYHLNTSFASISYFVKFLEFIIRYCYCWNAFSAHLPGVNICNEKKNNKKCLSFRSEFFLTRRFVMNNRINNASAMILQYIGVKIYNIT